MGSAVEGEGQGETCSAVAGKGPDVEVDVRPFKRKALALSLPGMLCLGPEHEPCLISGTPWHF